MAFCECSSVAHFGFSCTLQLVAMPCTRPQAMCDAACSLPSTLQHLRLQDNARRYDSLSARLTRDSAVLLNDARVSIDEVRRELKSQSSSTGKLGLIEARLGSLEGSILSAGEGITAQIFWSFDLMSEGALHFFLTQPTVG